MACDAIGTLAVWHQAFAGEGIVSKGYLNVTLPTLRATIHAVCSFEVSQATHRTAYYVYRI